MGYREFARAVVVNDAGRDRRVRARADPRAHWRGTQAGHGCRRKFGRKRKLSDHQRAEAIKRRAAGETLASIAKSYAVDLSMISRLEA